jgi:hypothetical protein
VSAGSVSLLVLYCGRPGLDCDGVVGRCRRVLRCTSMFFLGV